jgi:hypothetical protein
MTRPLTSRERFYPLGYPVVVESGDPGAIALIESRWAAWKPLVCGNILRIQLTDERNVSSASVSAFQVSGGGFRLQGPSAARFDAGSLRLEIGSFSPHFLDTALLTALDFALYTPLHAACVVRDGTGVLLCGESGAGKSTLAYACAQSGWTLVADDSVHMLPGDLATVASLSPAIHLREPARDLFPELEATPAGIAPNGKRALEIVPQRIGLSTAPIAIVDRVVFLSRRPRPSRLESFDAEAAERYFSHYLWQPNLGPHKQRIRDLLNRTGALRFEYEHAGEAAEALQDLLEVEGAAA